MTGFDLFAAGIQLFSTLIWLIITRHIWSVATATRPRLHWLTIATCATSVITLHNAMHGAFFLLPPEVRTSQASIVNVAIELTALASMALGRHMLHLMPLPERRPSRRWLGFTYGVAAGAGVVYVLATFAGAAGGAVDRFGTGLLHAAYLVLGPLCVWDAMRAARPTKSAFSYAGEILRSDVIISVGGGLAASIVFLLLAATGYSALGFVVLEVGLSLAIATPIAMAFLPVLVIEFLVMMTMLADIVLVGGGYLLIAAGLDASFHLLLGVTAALILATLLVSGQSWLRAALYRLIFRRNMEQFAELRAFLHRISPEEGVTACCRRALAELVRVRQLRGAAIVLRDGDAVVEGSFDLGPLLDVWPRGAASDALPDRPFGTAELRTLPSALRDALADAGVGLGAVPLVSPTRRWGHLFMNTGVIGGFYRPEDVDMFASFATQLALQLDGAALFARAVAVERSLAHAQKLAAIGETAARIAHEIRNPVTAARSLAQQLNRSPTAPDNAEYAALILTELERVEHQIASLLRFARREEYRFEAVDVGELARTTVDGFRPRLDQARIAVVTDTPSGHIARADREKLRQVLVNLLDNAIDALALAAAPKQLALAVGSHNGSVSLGVSDSGPGVSDEALAQLFEPFFSLKENGTGLGLAIAKRTVEAHGGHIAARNVRPGLRVEIVLPSTAGR